ncbi:MAG: alpha/beta fold hydrolase [Gammaproteobacteria bacterium]|nr:alpha/beta fold hydrolase [Gammaproteobacteria bacterium]
MEEFRLKIGEADVSAVFQQAESTKATIVFAHGAGAGMRHSTLESIASVLLSHDISMYRFNFPYMEAGKNRVDSNPVACEAIATALNDARSRSDGPFFLGGHSFGGRMASHAVVDLELAISGLIFCSFPLHTAKRVNTSRADHMDQIQVPMLFLSGTRDSMATPDLMNEVVQKLGANLHWLDTADHGYKVLKRTRKREDDVFSEMGGYISAFVDSVLAES